MDGGIEIRAPREEEFHTAVEVSSLAFGEETSKEDEEAYRRVYPFERSLWAFEAGRLVATSGVFSLELTLPGSVAVPMGGVTWIATLPTHRRRGLLSRLMTAQLADMADRGEMISGLGASEGSIYGRFGYGPATSIVGFSVERPYAEFARASENGGSDATAGRIILLDADQTAVRLPAIYEGLRLRQPGAVSRPQGIWSAHLHDPMSERQGASAMYHAIHETVPGVADGYVSYRVRGNWKGSTALNEVLVVEVLAADPAVYKALWEYVLGTDLCQTVSCGRGRVDEPLRWLLASPRRFAVNELSDFLWLRLLDVPGALATRAYQATGRVVFEVTESFPEHRRACYLLQADQAGASGAGCATTDSQPDLALEIDALSAAYLGGVTFATLAAAGRVRELKTGAIERADAMFSSGSAPFCNTEF
jgi:predicted acetyltransferase